jgi:peroxiredoxin Q/BCP
MFIAKQELGVGLRMDADTKVMKAFAAHGKKPMYGKEVEGVMRSTVQTAPDGVTAHHGPKGKAEGHAKTVRAALAALQGGAARVEAPAAVRLLFAAPPPAASDFSPSRVV